MTAEEVLAKAADLVEFSGRWAQEGPWDKRICAMYALLEAAGCRRTVPEHGHPYIQAYMAVVKEADIPTGITRWNDVLGRTKEEVATVFRNAKRWL